MKTNLYFGSDNVTSTVLHARPAANFKQLWASLVTDPPQLEISRAGYQNIGKSQQRSIKEKLPCLIACTFPSSPWCEGRNNQNAQHCNLIFIDVDSPAEAARLMRRLSDSSLSIPFNFGVYKTVSYTDEAPRLRIIVEAESIQPQWYKQSVQTVVPLFGLTNIDRCSAIVSQPMIVPCIFKEEDADADYPHIHQHLSGRAFTEADIMPLAAAADTRPPSSSQGSDESEGLEHLVSKVPGYETAEDVKPVLDCLDPGMNYPEWLKVAAGIKHQLGDEGFPPFNEWSEGSQAKYDPDAVRRTWGSLKSQPYDRKPITFKTVLRMAKQAGYQDALITPHPLPSLLASVPPFDCDKLLPPNLRGYVQDCAERLQVDPAFVAVPLLVSLGSVLGNRLGLRPKVYDDYTEFANIWGAIMGRPATLKSPSLSVALRFIEKLEKTANEAHQECRTNWKLEQAAAKIRRQAAAEIAKKEARKGKDFDVASLMLDAQEESGPPLRRFTCNDASPESLHSILSRPENATGVLLFTDELSGLIARMNDPERGAALRSFLLSGWNGYQSAVVDRIGRGENLRVDRCCISVLGGIQPGKLAPLVDAAVKESAQDDGWLQRFSLLVYPDAPEDFQCIDRAPDAAAYAEIMGIFERVESTPGEQWPGAEQDPQRGIWFIRFEPIAAAHFNEWMEMETKALRAGDLGAAVESHFFKYRKAVCALALLFHVAAEPEHTAVSLDCLSRALSWLDYLKPHALRVYGSRRNDTAKAAARILERLRKRDLPEQFTVHQLKRPCWTGLTDGETIKAALAMLVDHGWLTESEIETGGRPRLEYITHPKLFTE